MIYYNDNDPFCVKWLNNLIKKKIIPNGFVDDRDIKNIKIEDLKDFTQCHFFAGIGGWPIALKYLNFSKNIEIWTGSCPCQPFSNVSCLSKTFEEREKDERHLWPYFKKLIQKRKPSIIFGEQVASKLGLQWYENVRNDLENCEYQVGAADLCAASIGTPHIRQRLYWGAISSSNTISFRWRRRKKRSWKKKLFNRLVCDTQKSVVSTSKSGLLVDGVQFRSSKLRSYGNAIIPDLGAIFIKSFIEAHNENLKELK